MVCRQQASASQHRVESKNIFQSSQEVRATATEQYTLGARPDQEYTVEREAGYRYHWVVALALGSVCEVLEEELEEGENVTVDVYCCWDKVCRQLSISFGS